MLTKYIEVAMHRATYERIEDGTFFAEIPEMEGLWANAETLKTCQDELQEVLSGWIVLGLRLGHTLPMIEGIDLSPELEPVEE